MTINEGFAMDQFTAKELLDLFLLALDCKESVLKRFTHFNNSTIAKDTFKKKKGTEKIFTCITKRNFVEIIFCAIGMNEYGRNLKVETNYFKKIALISSTPKIGNVKVRIWTVIL